MQVLKNANGRGVLLSMVAGIQENKQYLGEVDGLIGDGDHGMNMNKGFTIYAEKLGEGETSFSDGLSDLGAVLLGKIGGSMGPIYGTLFMGMAEEAEGRDQIDLPLFTRMLEAGIRELYDIIDARPGDKTLVDTLHPAFEALKAAGVAGKDFRAALEDMSTGAKSGMESTKDMVAKYGRSARLGERSRGVLDAGAVSCRIILTSMATGIIKEMESNRA